MAQDLRNMFADKDKDKKQAPPKGHQARFKARLEKDLPQQKTSFSTSVWLKVAAVLVVLLAVGFLINSTVNNAINTPTEVVDTEKEAPLPKEQPVYLSDISPEFKKIENYYLAGIHTQLSRLKITEENKVLIDDFMEQLAELDTEYQALNEEINEAGVTEQGVNALINNLELRLDLLLQLKEKLQDIKESNLADKKAINI